MTSLARRALTEIRRWMLDPRVRDLDVDSPEFSLAHRQVLLDKPLTQALFRDFYSRCRSLDDRFFQGSGKRVEIGSGSGFMAEYYPDVITSDVKPLPFVQMAFSAEQMPFADGSVRAIYAINTFHHLPSPRAFFRELLRVLAPGGGVILIEPYYGPLAKRMFKVLHATEGFDEFAADWESPDQTGPFSKANQALSYLVFTRDRQRFESEFPGLSILLDEPHTHLRYFLSGGVNFRSLVPAIAGPLVTFAERALSPFDRWLALQHTIVLRRNPVE